jgi:Ca-activated chloride channel family protein
MNNAMRSAIIILLMLYSIVSEAQVDNKDIRKGNREYYKKSYSEAELHYRKALEKMPNSKKANYNLGNSLYKQDQFESAITKYESLTSNQVDSKNLSKYYYNLGNSYFKSQKIENSIEAFKQSLRLNPKDQDAKHNLFLAQNLLKQQQQQKQQQQNQNKDQNKHDNKNDQQEKDKQKDQNQQQRDQQNQQDQKQKQGDQQISKEDAQRLLEALEQDEKNVLKKLDDQKALLRKIQVDKEW